jgi:protein-L-isoaspartate(D-aspartate) O-methyltransferase
MLTVDVREQMIQQQVRAWDVLDERVLEVLRKIPRERFVPESQLFLAYADVEVPLPREQHMLRPSVVGRLLQALALSGTEQVLQIGAGSGFVTACLAASAARVRSLEIFPELAEAARANLASLGIGNVEIVNADARQQDGGPRYDAIAVTASLPIDDELLQERRDSGRRPFNEAPRAAEERSFERQLAIGGRLFVVVGEPPVMEAKLIRRTGDSTWTSESLFETVIDPLVNAPHLPAFTF